MQKPQRSPMTRKQRAQLSRFIQQKRHTPSNNSPDMDACALVGFHFSPRRHGLTRAQCRLATQLLHRANRERPIRGASKQAQFRRALRIGGIISAVRHGRVGNGRWGRAMLGKRGGNVMRDHGPHILAANRRRILARRQAETVAPHPLNHAPLQAQYPARSQPSPQSPP